MGGWLRPLFRPSPQPFAAHVCLAVTRRLCLAHWTLEAMESGGEQGSWDLAVWSGPVLLAGPHHVWLLSACSVTSPVLGASLVAELVQDLPAMEETWLQSLGREDPLEKEMATLSSILAWKIP